jgi:hypothetical protein
MEALGMMRIRSGVFAASAAFLILGVAVQAQDGRKPGLWEITTTTTWQQTPFPPGMQLPPQAAAMFSGAPRTIQYCLTQEAIDRFGAPMPQSRAGCTIANVQKGPTSVSADWVCSGTMTGKGSIESHWSADGTATGKVHFVGSMNMGPNPTPVEFTSESSSVFKSSDCGAVKPPPLPPAQ